MCVVVTKLCLFCDCVHDSLAAHVLTIENAWLSYRNRRIFKLLKHALRAAVSDVGCAITGQNYFILCAFEMFT